MSKSKLTIRTTEELVKNVCTHYNEVNVSKAFRKCIKECILKQISVGGRKWSARETVEATVAVREETADVRVTIRLERVAIQVLCEYYGVDSATLAVHCGVFDTLCAATEEVSLKASQKIFYMIGQKNSEMQGFLNEIFSEVIGTFNLDGYVEPFCGTANVLLHKERCVREIICDNSEDMINLLQVMQKYPHELKLSLLSIEVSLDNFLIGKEQLKSSFAFKDKAEKRIKRAAFFFFCRFASFYGKGESYREEINEKCYRRHLDSLYYIWRRLQGVKIVKNDAIYFLKKKKLHLKKCLIYFDAPYISSEDYYKMNNTKKRKFIAHQQIAELTRALRKENVCLLSYRMTASESMKKRGISDKLICTVLDQLYLNQGFFYVTKKLKKKGQIEILLATVEFEGSKRYDSPLAEMEGSL